MPFRILERLMQRQNFSQTERHSDHSSNTPARMQVATWITVLIIAVILSLKEYQSFQMGTYRDDASYAVLARSLVYSNKYGQINVPGEPSAPLFPFGYPFLLTPLVLLFPDNLDALKVLSLIGTVLNASLLFWGWHWFSRRSYWWAIAVVGLYSLSSLTVEHTRMVMSEPIFTTFCLATTLLAEQAARRTQAEQNRWWNLLMSVTLTFVLFTRTIGLILVITIFAYLLLVRGRGFWKEFILIVAQMVTIVGLVVVATPVEPRSLLPSRYLGEANASFLVGLGVPAKLAGPGDVGSFSPMDETPAGSDPLDRRILLAYFLLGVRQHVAEDLRQVVLPFGGGARERAVAERIGIPCLPIIGGLLVFGLVILGYFRWFTQEGSSAFNLFSILYFGALFMWVWTGPRLLYPIQPQLYFGFLLGIEAILLSVTSLRNRTGFLRKFSSWMLASAVLTLISVFAYKSLSIDDSRLHAGDLQARTSWLKANTASSAIVMTEEPPTDFLYSGRKTVPYPISCASATELEDYLVKRDVDYILIAPLIQWQTTYTPSYSDGTARILALLPDLISENRITLIHSSDPDLVKVFSVQVQE